MKSIASAFAALRSGQGLKGQLMRGGVGSIAVKIASTALNLVLAIVLARLLGAEGFGVYSFIFALVTILAIPAQMGLPNLVVRETAKAQVAGRWDIIKGLWRWSSLMALGMSALLVVLGGTAAFVFADRFTPMQLSTFWWALALVPLVALGNLRGAALRGLGKVVKGQWPEFVLRPTAFILLMLGLALLVNRELTSIDAMLLQVAASGLAFIVGALLLRGARPHLLVVEKSQRILPDQWLVAIVPLAAVAGSNQLTSQMGVIAVGVLGDISASGNYRIAMQGGLLCSFVYTSLQWFTSPFFAKFASEKNVTAMQTMATIVARISFGVAILLSLCVIFLGRIIIESTFGEEYDGAYYPLLIICFGYSISLAISSSDNVLSMANYERDTMRIMLLVVIANVVFTVALVPSLGGVGASLAFSAAIIIKAVLINFSAKQKVKIRTSIF